MSEYCHNRWEHEREGREAARWGDRYDYEHQEKMRHAEQERYSCDAYYKEGYERELRRQEEERAQERYEEQLAERRAAERRAEEAYYEQQYEEEYRRQSEDPDHA